MSKLDTNQFDLGSTPSEALASELNYLLANYQVLKINVKGFFWATKGSNFFDLHERFEMLYTDLQEKIDAIAKRILMLGGIPFDTVQSCIEHSDIVLTESIDTDEDIAEAIIRGLLKLLNKQRKIVYNAGDYDDLQTLSMISSFIEEQEKQLWMFNTSMRP